MISSAMSPLVEKIPPQLRNPRYSALLVAIIFIGSTISLLHSTLVDFHVPTVSLDYHVPVYNASKVALIIENRKVPQLAPQILHMIGVLPEDWRFRFMGSREAVRFVNSSKAIQHQERIGKLDLTQIPKNASTNNQEEISSLFTNLWFYEQVLHPAEWLLVFQPDSIFCANSKDNLNNWLHYDWVGSPWADNSRYGGNGGLSLRRVSSIIQVLKHQQRIPGSEPEDVWLSNRLGHRVGSSVANATESVKFQTERMQYLTPMGYHTGGGGKYLMGELFGTPEKRKQIYEYCPEMKMTLDMDATQYIPGDCGAVW